MTMDEIAEEHPLKPFFPKGVRMLMLGSFPPSRKRWSMEFYYPNFQNDMWRIFGIVFFGDRDKFVIKGKKAFDREAIIRFLKEKGIALGDTVAEAVRLKGTASDADLKVKASINIKEVLVKLPKCNLIVSTGGKSAEILSKALAINLPLTGQPVKIAIADKRDITLYRMPSSSRAYPMSIEKKAAMYAKMFADNGIL